MERNSKNAAHGWHADGVNDKCERLEPSGVMNESNEDTKDSVQVCQFCMLRMSTCVASFMLLSTMISPMLKVCLSLYTLLRSHLFVNCCIRRYSLYTPRR